MAEDEAFAFHSRKIYVRTIQLCFGLTRLGFQEGVHSGSFTSFMLGEPFSLSVVPNFGQTNSKSTLLKQQVVSYHQGFLGDSVLCHRSRNCE